MTAPLTIAYPIDGMPKFDSDYYIRSRLTLARKACSETLDRTGARLVIAGLDKSPPAYATVTLLPFSPQMRCRRRPDVLA